MAQASHQSIQTDSETEIGLYRGHVSRVIYSDPSSDFRVYAVIGKDKRKSSLAVNSELKLVPGDGFVAHGNWDDYRGKPSFRAQVISEEIPRETKGIAAWLRSKPAKGVGERSIETLIEHFRDNLVEVIDKPERLMESGLQKKKAEAIAAAWEDNAAQAELLSFLGQFNIGPKMMKKVIECYGSNTRAAITENPWQLSRDIEGLGFATADRIALSMGKNERDDQRVEAALFHVMDERIYRRGHCGLTKRALINFTSTLLRLPKETVGQHMEDILERAGGLVYDEEVDLVYPAALYYAERNLADQIIRRSSLGSPVGITRQRAQELVDMAINELEIRRDEHQRNAVIESLCNATSIVTGGPGTGKSTIMRVLAHALSMVNCTVALCAPTGKASKRLTETTGRPAKTIHRLLMWDPRTKSFRHNSEEPLDVDWVIADEYSMVGTKIAYHQFDAISDTCGITVVGDIDQLSSVDPGNVLSDLIASGAMPVTRLMNPQRTGKGSGIALAAARINKGMMPLESGKLSNKGFNLEYISEPEEMLKRAMELALYELPLQGFDPMRDVQVLAAMKQGTLGVQTINQVMKATLNPYRDNERSVELLDRGFTIGDRVMHLRNDYEKGVFNGETGVVSAIVEVPSKKKHDTVLPGIEVDYDGLRATYSKEDIDDLDHSWAVTVHKSQGSEVPVVIFLFAPEHKIMLNRSIAYTALTRAKAKAWMIGTGEGLLQHTVSRKNEEKRYTALARRLNPNASLPHMENTRRNVPKPSRQHSGGSPFASPFAPRM